MFGYVDIYKDELKIKDYNTYKAYYCGLCKAIGKKHNQLSRLALNYDFTFMAILIDSLDAGETVFEASGCIKRAGKRKTVTRAKGLEFCADMNVLFTYFKLKDDISDAKSPKAMIELIPVAFGAKRIKKHYPDICNTADICLRRLAFLEKEKCDITDKVAHEFACIMQDMFACANPLTKTFGYTLGRLIYIMDACDDMPEDFKSGSYNPVSLSGGYKGACDENLKDKISDLLYNSLSALAFEYEQLEIRKNKVLLDNIIYLGLRSKCDSIINKISGQLPDNSKLKGKQI